MATRNELIYDIKEYFKKYSDDNNMSSRHIMYMYRTKRARNLRQLFSDLKKSFDSSITQSLCVGLEEVNSTLCGDDLGCKVLRSKEPIPKLIDFRNRNSLLSVTPTDIMANPFKQIEDSQLPHIFNRPFSNGIYAYKDNDDYIYILSKSKTINFMDCVYIKGIFEDPEALEDYTNCCGEDCTSSTACFTDDTEYPLQPFLIDTIRLEIIKELAPREPIREEKDNNSDDE